MVKKGAEGTLGETPSEIDSLQSQLEKVETLLQEHSKDSQHLKAQVEESKSLMKA
jgi:hypothetical protein